MQSTIKFIDSVILRCGGIPKLKYLAMVVEIASSTQALVRKKYNNGE